MSSLFADVRAIGIDAGLDAIGVAKAEPFLDTRRHLHERKAAGLHGGMHFTYGNPERATDPTAALPEARFYYAITHNRKAVSRAQPHGALLSTPSWKHANGHACAFQHFVRAVSAKQNRRSVAGIHVMQHATLINTVKQRGILLQWT